MRTKIIYSYLVTASALIFLSICRADETMVVNAAPDVRESSPYVVEEISGIGPLGPMPLQDTPYSVSVMSHDFLSNIQAHVPEAAFKYNPYTQVYIQSNRLADNINIRGFYNTLRTVDGMRINGAEALEDKERLEVMTGASGFMYGIGSPSGVVNYVLKRPTWSQLHDITIGNSGGSTRYLHGDFSGVFNDSGRVAWRLNMAGEHGDGAVSRQTHDRYLFSGALDFNITDDLLWQFDASTYYRKQKGMQIAFSPAGDRKLTSLNLSKIDSSKNYGQPWGFQRDEVSQIGSNLQWTITDDIKLRSAIRYRLSEQERLNVNSNNITHFSQPYNQTLYHISAAPMHSLTSGIYIDWDLNSYIEQRITAGISQDTSRSKASPDRTVTLAIPGSFDFSHPHYVDKPDYTIATRAKRKFNEARYTNYIVSDLLTFNEQWSILAGVNYTDSHFRTYNLNDGSIASDYTAKKATPTAALMYKPLSNITTYASYIQALEQGGTAPDIWNGSPVTNAGQMMDPAITDQYELGAKYLIDDLLLTAAAFYIEKANQYVDPQSLTYVQDGRQVHKGVELTATGKISERLTLSGSLTTMKATVRKNAARPEMEGKRISGVARHMGKLLAEYDLPWPQGLTLTGGAFYTGTMWNDTENTDRIPHATTFDLGARYRTTISATPVTLRLNINNITDKQYWLPYGYISDPRYVTFSGEVSF